MQLVGKHNEMIRLVCPSGKHKRCGTPYHQDKITTVYNIEVYQRHFYRVGDNAIKVHNPLGGDCGAVETREIATQTGWTIPPKNNIKPEFYHRFFGDISLQQMPSTKVEGEIIPRFYSGDQSTPELLSSRISSNEVMIINAESDLSSGMENHGGKYNQLIYILTDKNELRIGSRDILFHEDLISKGEGALSAGEIRKVDSKWIFDNSSGHFNPSSDFKISLAKKLDLLNINNYEMRIDRNTRY